MKLKVLGSLGGRIPGQQLPGFLINQDLLLDAGSAGASLSWEEQKEIKYLLLSHAHLDHLYGLAGLLQNRLYLEVDFPLNLYASEPAIQIIKEDFLNESILSPALLRRLKELLILNPLQPGKTYQVDNYSFKAIPVNHFSGAVGFFLSQGENTILYTGDTGPTERIWQEAKNYPQLNLIICEVSFPNQLNDVALASRHLTPSLLKDELEKAGLKNKVIYLYHLKPAHIDLLFQELSEIQDYDLRLLKTGSEFELEKSPETGAKSRGKPESESPRVPKFDREKDLYEQRKNLEQEFGVKFEPGEIIFEEGEPGKLLYIIEEGQVELYRMVLGRKKVLAIAGAGDIFGEVSVFFNKPREVSARALSEVRAFAFDRTAFELLIRNNYGIALKIIRMLAQRLQEADIHIENLLYQDNESKLLNTLIRAVEDEGIETRAGYLLRLTPEQLAMRTDLSSQEMKKILTGLIQAGLISFQQGFFRIPDLNRLKRLLEYLELKEEFEPIEKFASRYFSKSEQ